MCNCITTLSKPSAIPHPKGRIITNVELPTALIWDKGKNTLGAITISVAKVTVEGKATKENFTVQHQYCPFCGVKYGQDWSNES